MLSDMYRGMSKKVKNVSNISITDIAKMYDVAYNTAWRWTQRADFPKPFFVGSRPRWTLKAVWHWAGRRIR